MSKDTTKAVAWMLGSTALLAFAAISSHGGQHMTIAAWIAVALVAAWTLYALS